MCVRVCVRARVCVRVDRQVVTVFTMLVAFFSLNTSMYTNIMEQSKEIGIMRALGLTRFRVYRLYAYEAFFLIASSAILGVRGACVRASEREREGGRDGVAHTRLCARVYACAQSLNTHAPLSQVGIGILVGWSISAQQAIFTRVPLLFVFPTDLIVTVLVVSIVCSLLATFAPIRGLMRRSIVNIMRL
jgi:ABC-type antimicrobial peptide transport system permease subunit